MAAGASGDLAYTWGPGSGRKMADPDHYPVEGAFVRNEHVTSVQYRDAAGNAITRSLTGTGFDLSLFCAAPGR